MVRIQYASDLHINDWPDQTNYENFIIPVAPVLIVAGDVCSALDKSYTSFLRWCSRNWKFVIIITGNHEYYKMEPVTITLSNGQITQGEMAPMSMTNIDKFIARLTASYPNIIFLQNGASYILPGTNIRVVGATLWSAIDPMIHEEIQEKKGDYNATFTETHMGIRPTTPADICALHALQKAYLTSAIAPKQQRETIIVVTHHMPTLNMLEPHYRGERWHSCYASSDDELLAPNVSVWICGHSHRATHWQSPTGPLVIMNARGYNRIEEQTRQEDIYNPQAYFDIADR